MTHKEWQELIKKEFNVSSNEVKEIYHTMVEIYQRQKRYKKIINKDCT